MKKKLLILRTIFATTTRCFSRTLSLSSLTLSKMIHSSRISKEAANETRRSLTSLLLIITLAVSLIWLILMWIKYMKNLRTYLSEGSMYVTCSSVESIICTSSGWEVFHNLQYKSFLRFTVLSWVPNLAISFFLNSRLSRSLSLSFFLTCILWSSIYTPITILFVIIILILFLFLFVHNFHLNLRVYLNLHVNLHLHRDLRRQFHLFSPPLSMLLFIFTLSFSCTTILFVVACPFPVGDVFFFFLFFCSFFLFINITLTLSSPHPFISFCSCVSISPFFSFALRFLSSSDPPSSFHLDLSLPM